MSLFLRCQWQSPAGQSLDARAAESMEAIRAATPVVSELSEAATGALERLAQAGAALTEQREAMAGLTAMSETQLADARKTAGPAFNALRDRVTAAIGSKKQALADATLDTLDSESRFWRLLGKAAAYTLIDQPSAAQRSVDEARARLGRVPAATPRHHLWLESFAIGALFRTEDSAKLIPRSVELRIQSSATTTRLRPCCLAW